MGQLAPWPTGTTRMVLQLADPISHVRAAALLTERLRTSGIDAMMVPIHVRPNDLAALVAVVRRLPNVAGLGITMPHKQAIVPRLDALDDAARSCGAVNWVRRDPDGSLVGAQIDGECFVSAIDAAGIGLAGRSVLLVGAGGVARAIAFALAGRDIAHLHVSNRGAAAADRLVADLATAGHSVATAGGPVDPSSYDVVVNATSLGARPDDPLPVDVARLAPGTDVCEVVASPPRTALVVAAQARGLRAVPGTAMLEDQLDVAARFLGLVRAPE